MTIGISQLEPTKSAEHTFLYVFSPSKEERLYQIQMDTLTDRQLALSDHDVVVAEVFETEGGHIGPDEIRLESSTGLRREYHISPGQFKVVLVGKDSAVKLSSESFVSCEEVLMRIENIDTNITDSRSWR